jgi:hypothetical protein
LALRAATCRRILSASLPVRTKEPSLLLPLQAAQQGYTSRRQHVTWEPYHFRTEIRLGYSIATRDGAGTQRQSNGKSFRHCQIKSSGSKCPKLHATARCAGFMETIPRSTAAPTYGWELAKEPESPSVASVDGTAGAAGGAAAEACSCSRSSRSYTSSTALWARSMVPLAAPALHTQEGRHVSTKHVTITCTWIWKAASCGVWELRQR